MIRDLRICRADIPDTQGMDIAVSGKPRKVPELFRGHVQELLKPFCRNSGIKTLTQFRLLGGHANRAISRIAQTGTAGRHRP